MAGTRPAVTGSNVIGWPGSRLWRNPGPDEGASGYGLKFGEAAHSWNSISASATQIRSEGNFRDAGGHLTSSTNALVENPMRSQSSWV
jgi:hypothetical protein